MSRSTRAIHLAVAITGISLVFLVIASLDFLCMPGHSYTGPPRPLTNAEIEISKGLRKHIRQLAGAIGERNMLKPENLEAAANYVESIFREQGYKVENQHFTVNGRLVRNCEVELPGSDKSDEIIIVGAHYDSVPNCPGANDNASGVSGVLELSRLFARQKLPRTIRFVTFVNEEDPYFGTEQMGSYQYAQRCRSRGEKLLGVIAIETIGYHTDRAGSQKLPLFGNLFYPDVGNFAWFVGNQPSKDFVRRCTATFRKETPFPSYGVAAPEWVEGVDWCDQFYFWKNGYSGLMVTDSAPYRYPHYHTAQDTPDKIDYERTARIIMGLEHVVSELATN